MRSHLGTGGVPALWTLKNKKIGKVKKFTFPIFYIYLQKKAGKPRPQMALNSLLTIM